MNHTTLEGDISNPDKYKREFRQRVLDGSFGTPCDRIRQMESCISSACSFVVKTITNLACIPISCVGYFFEQMGKRLACLATRACSYLRGGKIEGDEDDVDEIPPSLRDNVDTAPFLSAGKHERIKRALNQSITLKPKDAAVIDDTSSDE